MKIIHIPLTIPNALSLYRLFSFPFVLIFIFLGHHDLFVFFIWFNLTTDILDGWIARKFNQVTEIGARIDGLADTGTYILGLTGIFVFKWTYFQPHAISFFTFIGFFIISRLFSFIKLGRFHGFQTYGGKIGGYIHGTFFLVLFIIGFYQWFYYVMIISGIIVFSENVLITLVLSESRSNVKGLYWLLKTRKDQENL
jgi:cardiolipin synthase (CMP-forming)